MPQSAPSPKRSLSCSAGRPSAAADSCEAPDSAGLGLGAPALLAACGTQAAKQTADSCVSKDLSSSQKTLDFSNWPLYLDEKKVKRGGKKVTVYPTLEGFQKDTGIKVDYIDGRQRQLRVLRQDAQPAGRLQAHRPRHHGADRLDGGPDGEPRLAAEARQGEDPQRRRQPGPERSSRPAGTRTATTRVPWQCGLTGIAYNAKVTKEVKSFDDLLTRPDLKGKVSLLSEMHDTMLFMLLLEGADPERLHRRRSSAPRIDKLKKAVDAGPDPHVHRQRLRPGPGQGRHRGLRGLVRRRHPAPVRQPQHQVRRARGGADALDRQHAGPEPGRPTRPTPRS